MKQPPPEGTWEQFVETARRIIAVPETEIDLRDATYKRKRALVTTQPKAEIVTPGEKE